MEMSRRAVLAGAIVAPAAISAKSVVATPISAFEPLRPGEVLIGMHVRNDRIVDPGRRLSAAAYNREFGAQFRHDGIGVIDCSFVGCTDRVRLWR